MGYKKAYRKQYARANRLEHSLRTMYTAIADKDALIAQYVENIEQLRKIAFPRPSDYKAIENEMAAIRERLEAQ